MIFHEIYGSYYHALAAILRIAGEHPITRDEIYGCIHAYCFGESGTTIPDKLKSGEWPLLKENRSVLAHAPRFPTSTLERRWLATILRDPRVRLFLTEEPPTITEAPLWQEEDLLYYDQHHQGDPFTEETYIRNFRAMLSAFRGKKEILIRYQTVKGKPKKITGAVVQVEYSQKDDKFRFRVRPKHNPQPYILNARNILSTTPRNHDIWEYAWLTRAPEEKSVTVEITDERNALNRTMLHFSDLAKTTTAIDEKTYQMNLRYYAEEETEILIRILSFGPFVKVIGPEDMVEKVKARLVKQRGLVISNQ